MDGDGDVAIDELQPGVAIRGSRLVGEPEVVKGAIEPIAGGITGEDAARSIPAMRCRSKSNHQEPRVGWTEAGDGPSPVFPVTESGDFFARDLLAIRNKPRASATVDDLILGGPLEHSE